jgi:hypothetical protein
MTKRLPMRAPLSCSVVDKHAVRYFFAGVAGDVDAGIERHFARCPRCRRKMQLFDRVWRRDGLRRAAEARR